MTADVFTPRYRKLTRLLPVCAESWDLLRHQILMRTQTITNIMCCIYKEITDMRIVIGSAGRRVYLVRWFQQALRAAGIDGEVVVMRMIPTRRQWRLLIVSSACHGMKLSSTGNDYWRHWPTYNRAYFFHSMITN